ncbi:MAG: thioredoxin [Oculatellaceae cyanobacterium Prado106]|nr:thioredoxin [Oculatellaceae cyanobacterium Prado106]
MATKQKFSSFQELLTQSEVPLVVDFYATWCGPCQMMAKILEQVNSEMQQRVKIVKIDTEKYPDLASQYQIYALPTLVIFKDGRPVDRVEGVVHAHQLVQRLNQITGSPV